MRKLIFPSPLGDLSLIVHNGNLCYCNWVHSECAPKERRILKSLPQFDQSKEDKKVLESVASQLTEYFAGERKFFDVPQYFHATKFQLHVWQKIREIPSGTTATYKEVSNSIGSLNSFRAVANACGQNPLAIIIPCHRVVKSDDSPGGYTGGLDKKTGLLYLERRFCL